MKRIETIEKARPPSHHRNPGLIVAALEDDRVSLQVIVDNVHLHPAIVRLLYRVKGAENLVLVSDALQAMGMGDGRLLQIISGNIRSF
jgi:N-acetylglucosamine-6-phosphate deacetylase